MENEPDKPQSSSVPPPPDMPPPPPPSAMPPPPDVPPPPVSMPPPVSAPPPVDPYVAPAKDASLKMDGVEEPSGVKEADFGTRLIAAIIDGVAATVIVNVLATIKMGMIGWLVSIVFYLTRDALPFLDGQSPGKKLMNLRAVDAAGKKLTNNWQVSITRNVMLVIPFVGGLIECVVLLMKKNSGAPLRRLGDDWAKTKVVVVPKPEGTP